VNVRNAGRLQEPTCDEFLDRHSEYVDNLLTPLESARLALHARGCDSCARYDRVVRRSQALMGDLPEIEPSEDFELRLQHRIFHIDDEAAFAPARGGAGAVATLAVAASLALLAWSPLLLRERTAPREFTAVPDAVIDPLFHGGDAWYPAPVRAPAPMATLASMPGPHSPLIVSPPVHRSADAVELAPVD